MTAKLREVREHEGLSRSDLARLADLSERTLQRCETGQDVLGITKHKILNALNRREGLREYTLADLFDGVTPTDNGEGS